MKQQDDVKFEPNEGLLIMLGCLVDEVKTAYPDQEDPQALLARVITAPDVVEAVVARAAVCIHLDKLWARGEEYRRKQNLK